MAWRNDCTKTGEIQPKRLIAGVTDVEDLPETSSNLEPSEDQEVEEDPLEDSLDSWRFGGGISAKFGSFSAQRGTNLKSQQPIWSGARRGTIGCSF